MRNLQIGVIGSMADLEYSEAVEQAAESIGREIANRGYALVFGAEKDSPSLPTLAAKAAIRQGAITVGVTYEKELETYDPSAASIIIATGLVRGGGREMVQSLSCDGLIAISGGSGTLNEIAVAYQANIPVVVMENQGGWAGKLANTYLDDRRRYKFETAKTAKQAMDKLIKMVESR